MITKHDFILRGSCFCDKYSNTPSQNQGCTLRVWRVVILLVRAKCFGLVRVNVTTTHTFSFGEILCFTVSLVLVSKLLLSMLISQKW